MPEESQQLNLESISYVPNRFLDDNIVWLAAVWSQKVQQIQETNWSITPEKFESHDSVDKL